MLAGTAGSYKSITRRLFFIFIAFALVPVVALSVVAVRYISSTSQAQLQRMLASEVDAFADLTHGRLTLASRRLELYAEAQAAAETAPTDREVWKTLDADTDSPLRFARVGRTFLPENIPLDAMEHLESARTLMLVQENAAGLNSVFLLREIATGPGAGELVAAEISELFLLGEPDSRNLTLDNCVYGPRGQLLFATSAIVCEHFAGWDSRHRGNARSDVNGNDYYATWRNLFIREQFSSGDWRTSVITPDATVLRSSELFTSTFLAFGGLALLVLSLLSVRLIRRQMSPLDQIMAGIGRVARREYDQPVDVASGDEFEAMADAFNDMSRRVSHQITTMGSMSEIDQLILSRGKKEDILGIVLERTRHILPGEYFALLLPEDDGARLCTLGDHGEGELESTRVALGDSESEVLLAGGVRSFTAGEEGAPAFLDLLDGEKLAAYRLVPAAMDTRLVALLVIGCKEEPPVDAEADLLAGNYADRIAVALANAEWEEKLYHQANYDTLTELPNRPALIDELGRRLARAEREAASLGVLFIDLDNFKLVNDSLGHDTGDRFIAATASRLADCLRENDVVARLGGDEFIIVSSESSSHAQTVAAMNGIASRVLTAISEPLTVDGQEIRSSASLGIALFPRDGNSAQELMKNADVAMYHAKAQGPGRYQFYSEELNAQAVELMQLSTELKAALERGEFVLHYQPKVTGETRALRGAEALIRWQHPRRGLLAPGSFIEAAETLGLINTIGDWALSETCRQLEAWKNDGCATVPVAVNIAPGQIHQGDIVGQLSALLEKHGLAGTDLELEITERLLLRSVDRTIATLDEVRALGVGISIDDYGTGYSSLSYMKHLPVTKLKIDGSFITDLATDPADQAIVSSAILLARRLGLIVVAEGVEREEQALILNSFGCDEIQGYLFSRPLPADDFVRLLDKTPRTPAQDQLGHR